MATISTTAELNSLFNEIFDEALVVLREENIMVANGLVKQMNGRGFATRTVPIWNKATVIKKTEGVDFVGHTKRQKTAEDTFTPEVRMAGFIVTREMVETAEANGSNDDIINEARAELAEAIAEQIDIDLISEFSNFSTTKGTAGQPMTLGVVGAALAVLRHNKIKGPRSVVLEPYQWQDIWVALGQPAAQYAFLGETASMALREGFVSNLQGATWFTTANIDIDANDDAPGGVFARDGLGFDLRQGYEGHAAEYDASLRGWELIADIAYDHGVLRQGDGGVKLISDATEPT